jgi:signal transduction histidine kinase
MGSIRARVVLGGLLLLFVSALMSLLVGRAILLDQVDRDLEAATTQEVEEFELLSRQIDPTTGEVYSADPQRLFDAYFTRELADEGEVLLAFLDGDLYRSSHSGEVTEVEELAELAPQWRSLSAPMRGSLDTSVGEARYQAIPVGSETARSSLVAIGFPDLRRQQVNQAVRNQIAVQSALFVVVAAVGYLLAARLLRPLASLSETASTINDSDLSRRIDVNGHDEVAQIARSFNDMLDRLERAFTSQREFLDNTSHELRSPLTVVRGHVELLPLAASPEERQETADLVLDEVDRMTRMLADLTLLARSEHPRFLAVEAVDLHDLTMGVHRKARALGARDWRVEPAPAGVILRADPRRLTQAVLQLAENAVRHTEDGGAVTIGSSHADGSVTLWVEDDGVGVPPQEAESIFERFKQGERAGSSGLGLSIVQAIARAHGGSARLDPRPGPGARFEIRLPTRASVGGQPQQT